ncbi:MAG: PadR family transcriptional regulator, regulatory protein PadR [Actinomycetota bacterium]|nr:PadR family transcriptional regulator, regulatory protein PadR [Actinomycetota bacterium]
MRATDTSQLRKGVLEIAVLALLDASDSYGRQLVERLGGVPGLLAGPGTVYPLLTRLEKNGLVTTAWRDSPQGPPRKYYCLTPRGRRHLAAQAAAWDQLHDALTTVLREVSR